MIQLSATEGEVASEPLTSHATVREARYGYVGIIVSDPSARRLIEGASLQLGLKTSTVEESAFASAPNDFELIIADEPVARRMITLVADAQTHDETIHPAIVAVRHSDAASPAKEANPDFDGVLSLPMPPAAAAAQLSLILYAHRAFAQRYESALEELHLNRRIFRSVTSGISVANARLPDLPLVYVNPAFEIMTGYSLEDVLGRNCRFLQGSDHDQHAVSELREALRKEREVTVVLKNYRKDGTCFWNELRLSPIRSRTGELTHFVGIQTDITARVEFESALRESEKLAAVGRLASTIAHEINNPLEAVTNLLYLARHGDSTGDTMRYLDLADEELRRVALITSQSLRFYKQSTRPQAIACDALVDSVLDLYEGRAANSVVIIERRDRKSPAVVCLESEIRQVLNNLVRNGIDAMHGKGGRMLIRTRHATDWRTGVLGVSLTVADTGMGMSPNTIEHIYKPFFTTKGIAGTGLGLWVSSEIVARHRGRLRVRSTQRPGSSGTVFSLFLPLNASSDPQPSSAPVSQASQANPL